MIVLWLLACSFGEADSGDSDTASTCTTGLTGVLYRDSRENPSPESGGKIVAVDTEGESIETLSDTDGLWTLPVWPGTWTVSGTNATQDCFTDEDPVVEVVECDAPYVELFTDLCYGR